MLGVLLHANPALEDHWQTVVACAWEPLRSRRTRVSWASPSQEGRPWQCSLTKLGLKLDGRVG